MGNGDKINKLKELTTNIANICYYNTDTLLEDRYWFVELPEEFLKKITSNKEEILLTGFGTFHFKLNTENKTIIIKK